MLSIRAGLSGASGLGLLARPGAAALWNAVLVSKVPEVGYFRLEHRLR